MESKYQYVRVDYPPGWTVHEKDSSVVVAKCTSEAHVKNVTRLMNIGHKQSTRYEYIGPAKESV